MKEVVYLLVFTAGAVIAVQAAVNAKLGIVLQNKMHAVVASFLIGTVGGILYVLIEGKAPRTELIREAPWWIWIGGLLGLGFVWSTIWAVPRIGVSLLFPIVVAGQMSASLVMEHFGLFSTAKQPVNWGKLTAVGLVIAGAVLFAWSKEQSPSADPVSPTGPSAG